MYLILSTGFLFVQVLIGSIVKFWFLAQFPMNHLPHPVFFSRILLLRQFATFTYYVIYDIVSITAKPTLAILLHIIDLVLMALLVGGVVIRRDSVSLLSFLFRNHVHVF